jgi:hypothetical protein
MLFDIKMGVPLFSTSLFLRNAFPLDTQVARYARDAPTIVCRSLSKMPVSDSNQNWIFINFDKTP